MSYETIINSNCDSSFLPDSELRENGIHYKPFLKRRGKKNPERCKFHSPCLKNDRLGNWILQISSFKERRILQM